MIDRTWYVYRNLGRMDDGSSVKHDILYMTDNSFLPHNYIYTLNVILCNKRKFTGTVANVCGVECSLYSTFVWTRDLRRE